MWNVEYSHSEGCMTRRYNDLRVSKKFSAKLPLNRNPTSPTGLLPTTGNQTINISHRICAFNMYTTARAMISLTMQIPDTPYIPRLYDRHEFG